MASAPQRKPSIDTCNACGKLFPRTTMRLCGACRIVEDHRFELVRDYLHEHDGGPLMEIAAMTGVSVGDVRRFVDRGRLTLVELGSAGCTCDDSGVRCRYCRGKLSLEFRELEESMRAEGGDDDLERTSYVRRIRRLGTD